MKLVKRLFSDRKTFYFFKLKNAENKPFARAIFHFESNFEIRFVPLFKKAQLNLRICVINCDKTQDRADYDPLETSY